MNSYQEELRRINKIKKNADCSAIRSTPTDEVMATHGCLACLDCPEATFCKTLKQIG
jgi:hypothetical protein